MSTYLYLVCLDHTPLLMAAAESGQHMYDLPQIRADIAERERIVANAQDDIWPDDHFRKNTAAFLVEHPRCRIGIADEYGEMHPTKESPIPPPPLAEQIAREHRSWIIGGWWLGCTCGHNATTFELPDAHIATVTEQAVRERVAGEIEAAKGSNTFRNTILDHAARIARGEGEA